MSEAGLKLASELTAKDQQIEELERQLTKTKTNLEVWIRRALELERQISKKDKYWKGVIKEYEQNARKYQAEIRKLRNVVLERRTVTDEHIRIISNAIRGAGFALIDKSVAELIEGVARENGKKVNVCTIEDTLSAALEAGEDE